MGFKFGRWIDSVMMQRPLGPGDSILPGAWPTGTAEQPPVATVTTQSLINFSE